MPGARTPTPPHLLVDRNPLPAAITGDLRRTLEFVIEVDRMKAVLRESPVAAVQRRENDAEHSWHLALMALVLERHAAAAIDRERVLEMLLVHDLVEVYAGDVPLHELQDDAARARQAAREREAADRLFAIPPTEVGERLRAAWEEFEAHRSPESRFARAMDRLQPLLLGWMADGGTWRARPTTADAVRHRLRAIREGAPTLWPVVEAILDESERRGHLSPSD